MRRGTVAVAAATLGFGQWLVCLSLLHREPWDVSLGLYCLVLAAAGAASVWLASPRRPGDVLLWPACIVLGELLFLATQPDRWSLWPLAVVALAVFGLPAVAGAMIGQRILRRWPGFLR
jgi:hypothetical protein